MRKLNSLFFIIALFLCGIAVNGQNLLTNGDFEGGAVVNEVVPGWTNITNFTTNSANTVTEASKLNGSWGYNWTKGSQNDVRRGQIIDVTAGTVYTITVNYRFLTVNNPLAPFAACYFYPTGEAFSATADYAKAETAGTYATGKLCWIPGCAIAAVNGTYQTFTANVTAPAGVDKMFFELYWHRATLYLDDISVVVNTSPTVVVAPTSLVNMGYTEGNGPSASKTVSLSGVNLTGAPENLTVTGTTNFEVSSDNSTFGATASIPYSAATLASTNFYVRLKAGLSSGVYNAENVVISGGGLTPVNLPCSGYVSSSYTWQGADGGDWTTAANWNPSRTPAIGDVLIFDGFTGTVINVPNESIGQLKLIASANVTLQNNGANSTLTINGSTGVDFSIPAGSHLQLKSTGAANATTMNINLNTDATGEVVGQISVLSENTTAGANHRITTTVADALHFKSGSTFHATTGFVGYPFGSTPNSAVVFESGSTYRHSSGNIPFGGANTVRVSVFEAGSYYLFDGIFTGITVKPAVGGKTYGGTFEINTTNGGNVIGNSNPSVHSYWNHVKVYGTQWAIGGNTNGAETYIAGNVTVGTGGKFRFGLNPGIISPVIFNGTSPQTVLLEDNGEFNNGSGSVMTIANDVTFDGNVLINGTLNINAGKTLTIASGKTLTLASTAVLNVAATAVFNVAPGGKITNSGTIANAGTINIQSNATDGTATIIGAGTISGAGTVNVNQSLQHPAGALRTWYVSSPVLETVSPTPALDRIKSFNETTNAFSATLTQMEPKIGYLVVPAAAANNLMFTGTLNTGNQNITLTGRQGVGAQQGFNLIGNPYPSYLDWKAIIDYSLDQGSTYPNRSALRSETMWYRTKIVDDYYFWTVNGEGVGTPSTATNEIPPMQAFWVRAAENGSTLALTDAMRKHAPATNKLLKAPAVNDRTLVRLQVSNTVNSDEAVIYFSENAQNGLDKLDAPKMSNDNVEIPEIYTTLGSEKIVINSMNTIPMDSPIGLGFVAGSANSFSITANEMSNIPEGVKVILRDNVTLAETDLTDGTAKYDFTPETSNGDRFSLIFRSAGATTNLDNAQNDDLLVYYNNGLSIICNNDKLIGSMVSVYNGVGQLIISKEISAKNMKFNESFAPGVYVVKTNLISKKVIVK